MREVLKSIRNVQTLAYLSRVIDEVVPLDNEVSPIMSCRHVPRACCCMKADWSAFDSIFSMRHYNTHH
jgi:hypothetical protein